MTRNGTSSLLRLEKYELRNFSVQWHKMRKPEKGVELVPSFDFKVRSHQEDPRRFAVDFDCNVSATKRPKEAFEIKTSITGYFECPEEWEEDVCTWRAAHNGCAILYGVLRGLVANITAQFPHGTYFLPSVNMNELIKEILASKAEQAYAEESKLKTKTKKLSVKSQAKRAASGKATAKSKASKGTRKKES